ncbi:MAG: acyl--CoA ligase [Leptospira sp.]|nr:acyl--CoA ligase [Leptospira sp.]
MKEIIAEPDFFRNGSFCKSILDGEQVVFLDPALHSYRGSRPNFESNQKLEHHKKILNQEVQVQGTSTFDQISILRSTSHWEIAFRTSGSEGKPKLFLKSKKEIYAEIDFLKTFLNEMYFHPNNRSMTESTFLVSIPLCHIYGFLWGYMLPLEMGQEAKDCKTLSSIRNELISHTEHIKSFGNTTPNIGMIWITVPSQLEALYDLLDPYKVNLENTLIVVSGSRMKKKSAMEFQNKFATSILEIYGSTETGGMGYRFPAESESIELFDLIDAKIQGQRLSVRSPFFHPDLNNTREFSEGFFVTDDLGELIGKKFTYHGRAGRVIKKKGKRIHLDMIENLLLEFPNVKDAIVVDFSEEQIGALIQGELSRLDLESIPSILIPDKMIHANSLPKLPNGKKDYQSARSLFH